MARIAVLGAGVMGTALTYPLSDNGHQINLIGTHLDDAIIASCKAEGVHPRLGRALPPGVRAFAFSEAAAAMAGADVVALGVNSRGVRWAGRVLAEHLTPGQRVLMVTKGLAAGEQGELQIFPDLLAEQLPEHLRARVPIAAIGGPSIAGELAARRQTSVVFTCRDAATLDELAALFATEYYHIWTSTDIIGVEVCVALKNVYALGVGLVPGLLEASGGPDAGAAMHNHAAAFFAQGLAETAQLVQLMGGGLETVFGLPGAGDLYVTTQGGRNSRMGRLLGLGVDPEEASEQLAGETVEGVDAVLAIAPAVEKLIERGVLPPNALPLLRQIYAVAVKGRPVEPIFDQFFQQEFLNLRPAR
jgi:glycerol-3-phosphate dehydrogenase (NAD(P)+)